jgi:polyisoprenoid-binding protein YceI
MNCKRVLCLALLLGTLGLAVPFVFGPDLSATPIQPPEQESGSVQKFDIDPVHSSFLFRVKHLDVSYFYGRFKDMSGSFQVDDANPANNFVQIEVSAESVDSNNEGRDRHLKGQDFFSAKEFPSISFKSTKVEKAGKNTFEVTGDLTFRGVTRSIRFQAEHTGTASVSPRFGLRSGYEAVVDIKRSDFGDTYGIKDKVLGDELRLIISIEGMPVK